MVAVVAPSLSLIRPILNQVSSSHYSSVISERSVCRIMQSDRIGITIIAGRRFDKITKNDEQSAMSQKC